MRMSYSRRSLSSIAAFGALGTALLSTTTASAALTLRDVQNAITRTGANWKAGATSVSPLPIEARRAMMGVPRAMLHESHISVVTGNQELLAAAPLPAAFDWRNQNGVNFVSPIIDQGRCGSCVAFASVGTLETQFNIDNATPTSPWRFSPQEIFSCGGGGCGFGWDVDSAMQYLQGTGATDEACFPYTSGTLGADAQCSSVCSDAANRRYKIRGYTTPTAGGSSVTAVKAALMKGPLATTMSVYEDFDFYTGGVYKHVTGDMLGGHAISIIGWSDADQAWIVRNSWGPAWGEQGFFRIAWADDSGLAQDTWGINTDSMATFVELGLRDHAVLSGGAVAVPLVTKGVDNAQIAWNLSDGTHTIATGASPDGTMSTMDTSRFADGVYTLTAEAVGMPKPAKSEPRIVYVLNGPESGSMSFKDVTDHQTVSGTFVFHFDITAKPVPLTRVVFTATDSKGAVQLTRSSVNTGASMEMSFHTAGVPNGTYVIKLEGDAGGKAITPLTATVLVAN